MTPKILVIEDNEQNLYLLTFLLERHALEIIPARTGPQGIALASHVRPDLILLDIQLPGMDGYEVARKLKLIPSLAGVPIVAVTSYAMEGDREKGFAAGCVGCGSRVRRLDGMDLARGIARCVVGLRSVRDRLTGTSQAANRHAATPSNRRTTYWTPG